jgi:hypothetical protein
MCRKKKNFKIDLSELGYEYSLVVGFYDHGHTFGFCTSWEYIRHLDNYLLLKENLLKWGEGHTKQYCLLHLIYLLHVFNMTSERLSVHKPPYRI